jgi:hypothetical protein
MKSMIHESRAVNSYCTAQHLTKNNLNSRLAKRKKLRYGLETFCSLRFSWLLGRVKAQYLVSTGNVVECWIAFSVVDW